MSTASSVIREIKKLGFPWATQDPFLFCVYHADAYPKANGQFGPDASLDGRNLGNDFILKDGWRMYHGTKVPGFPVHPHRGFETVTVVRKGVVDHSDSLGGAGRYGHGDVQWMTAGKGIQHAEMFPLLKEDKDNPLELFQIWMNLPASRKMVDPHYTMLWDERIPKLALRDRSGKTTRLEVVAGSLQGEKTAPPAPDSWAFDVKNEVIIWYFEMDPGATWSLPATGDKVKRSLYFFEGDRINLEGEHIDRHCVLELKAGARVSIENGTGLSRFLYLQGRPIGEPVVSYGPFVMNTESEIMQTYVDYQESRFGGWPWPRHDQVHGGKEQGRFARYPGGKEELPPG